MEVLTEPRAEVRNQNCLWGRGGWGQGHVEMQLVPNRRKTYEICPICTSRPAEAPF